MAKELYFIALLPPPEIQEEVTAYKRLAAERFHAKRALNSPPHITLIPPFRLEASKRVPLLELLQEFNASLPSFSVELRDFSAFPPRVIYVDVVPNQELIRCQAQLESQCATLGIASDRTYGFHPHMTVAFKDLKRSVFPAAWAFFQEQSCQREFEAREVTLLHWRQGKWRIH